MRGAKENVYLLLSGAGDLVAKGMYRPEVLSTFFLCLRLPSFPSLLAETGGAEHPGPADPSCVSHGHRRQPSSGNSWGLVQKTSHAGLAFFPYSGYGDVWEDGAGHVPPHSWAEQPALETSNVRGCPVTSVPQQLLLVSRGQGIRPSFSSAPSTLGFSPASAGSAP